MKRLFFGGIHPKYNKEMSTGITFFKVITPEQVVIPMVQHIGAPCTPLVQVGDRVLRGTKVGDGEGLCVPVHASVAGKVIAVEPRPHTSGRMVMSVVIENDFTDEAVEVTRCDDPLNTYDDNTILHMIREAGLVGMGVVTIRPAQLDTPRHGASLMIMNTPALTIVEECSNAEVGVGATIAPSSQLLKGICAAFVIPANARNAAGIAIIPEYIVP